MVDDAIAVKEGQLDRVRQNYMFLVNPGIVFLPFFLGFRKAFGPPNWSPSSNGMALSRNGLMPMNSVIPSAQQAPCTTILRRHRRCHCQLLPMGDCIVHCTRPARIRPAGVREKLRSVTETIIKPEFKLNKIFRFALSNWLLNGEYFCFSPNCTKSDDYLLIMKRQSRDVTIAHSFTHQIVFFFIVFMSDIFADAKLYRNGDEKEAVDANELKVFKDWFIQIKSW